MNQSVKASIADMIRTASDPAGQIARLIEIGAIPVYDVPCLRTDERPAQIEPPAALRSGLTVHKAGWPKGMGAPTAFSAYIRRPNGDVVAEVMRDGGYESWPSLKHRAELIAAAGELAFALHAVLPYARSRLEDMTDNAEAAKDCPQTGAQAEANARRAGAAVDAAEALLARLGASLAPPEQR